MMCYYLNVQFQGLSVCVCIYVYVSVSKCAHTPSGQSYTITSEVKEQDMFFNTC